jgi:hypothetical protein
LLATAPIVPGCPELDRSHPTGVVCQPTSS